MFSTFGGNPVACRAALAVLDVIEEDDLIERAHRRGARLRAGLEAVASAPRVRSVTSEERDCSSGSSS